METGSGDHLREVRSDRSAFPKLDKASRHFAAWVVPVEVLQKSLADHEWSRLSAPPLRESHPAEQLSRLIREVFWDRLLRRIDSEGLEKIFRDNKMSGSKRIVYVPYKDSEGFAFYSKLAKERPDFMFEVKQLPARIGPEYVRELDSASGVLSLALRKNHEGEQEAVPYIVPGGRFNEMYGWDSYFSALGLINDQRPELAKSMTDNFLYQIENYGKILNANRSYYLTRSQPPLFMPMALAVDAAYVEHNLWPDEAARKNWLSKVVAAGIADYENVWMADERVDTATGLSRYLDSGYGFCPEVETGHYDSVVKPFAVQLGIPVSEYIKRFNRKEILNQELLEFTIHDRATRESGHDTSYRTIGRAASLNTVELNSLLYITETGIAGIIRDEFNGIFKLADDRCISHHEYEERASRRREQMRKHFIDPDTHLISDWDLTTMSRSDYVSSSSFFAFFAGWLSQEEAGKCLPVLLDKLEEAGGLAGSDEFSRGEISESRPLRQWDYPFGWAPHQIAACLGMLQYGFADHAERIAYKWLHMILKEAVQRGGAVAERYNVATAEVYEEGEYGTQGLTAVVDNGAGFAWTNASFQIMLNLLTEEKHSALNQMIAPSELFK